MKIYFTDGGSFQDYSRVGYDSPCIDYGLNPFPNKPYYTFDINDCFTEQEAIHIASNATYYLVTRGITLREAVTVAEKEMLQRKGICTDAPAET